MTQPTIDTPGDAARVERLFAEAGVRDATARFADAATRGDLAAFKATWTEDAQWSIGEHVHDIGLDNIMATFERMLSGQEFFVQFATQGPICINGDEARSSCLIQEAARGENDAYDRNFARVEDHLRRVEGQWLFTSRAFNYIWLDTAPFGGQAFSLARG